MTALIALMSIGKGTWAHAIRLIESPEFERAIILTNSFGKEKYTAPKKASVVELDLRKEAKELKEDMKIALKPLIVDEMEVAISIVSGTGIEHSALIAALFESGVGFRIVISTSEEVQYL